MMAAVLTAALMTAQPVMAETVEAPVLAPQDWANESLGPGAAVRAGDSGSGAENSGGPAAGSGSSVVTAGSGMESAVEVPAGFGTSAAQSDAQQQAQAASQAPAGDEGTVLSPVIVAGQGGARQQAEAAAPQAEGADAGIAQAAEETAAAKTGQAAEGTAQSSEGAAGMDQAAAEAGGQSTETTAQEAASQQTSGRQIDPSRPMVALTFDDGPQASVGNRIMDCLAQYGGKATFFLVGDRVNSHAAEVQRMAAEGHELANHSMNHKYLQKLGAAEIQAQVNNCNDVIQAVSGIRPTLMRLPGGNHNATVRANVHMPMIQWNIDTLDWKTRNADQTVAAVLNKVSDGDIVLMHELYSQTGDAALRIIPELAARGFQMVTVSEMAAAKGRTLEAGQIYSSMK